eukprot:s6688_g9.t3
MSYSLAAGVFTELLHGQAGRKEDKSWQPEVDCPHFAAALQLLASVRFSTWQLFGCVVHLYHFLHEHVEFESS